MLPGNDDTGQLDVAANALAVMILVTMILLTVAAAPVVRGAVRATDTPELPFPTELPPDSTPRPSFWIVTDAGLARLPLAEVAAQVAQGGVPQSHRWASSNSSMTGAATGIWMSIGYLSCQTWPASPRLRHRSRPPKTSRVLLSAWKPRGLRPPKPRPFSLTARGSSGSRHCTPSCVCGRYPCGGICVRRVSHCA